MNVALITRAAFAAICVALGTALPAIDDAEPWKVDEAHWGAQTQRHQIEVVTFRDARDFLHVIDPHNPQINGIKNEAEWSRYLGCDEDNHYAGRYQRYGAMLFKIGRKSISEDSIRQALINRKTLPTHVLPPFVFNEGSLVLTTMTLDQTLFPKDDEE